MHNCQENNYSSRTLTKRGYSVIFLSEIEGSKRCLHNKKLFFRRLKMKYEKLFEKGKIGKLTLKNRIVMPPMGTGFAAASGEA